MTFCGLLSVATIKVKPLLVQDPMKNTESLAIEWFLMGNVCVPSSSGNRVDLNAFCMLNKKQKTRYSGVH